MLAKTMDDVRQGIALRGDEKGVLAKCIKWELAEKLHVTMQYVCPNHMARMARHEICA